MPLRALEKENVFQPLHTSPVRMLESKVLQRAFCTLSDRLFWNEAFPGLLRSLVGFVVIFSEKTATCMKGSALVANLVQVVLFNFSK